MTDAATPVDKKTDDAEQREDDEDAGASDDSDSDQGAALPDTRQRQIADYKWARIAQNRIEPSEELMRAVKDALRAKTVAEMRRKQGIEVEDHEPYDTQQDYDSECISESELSSDEGFIPSIIVFSPSEGNTPERGSSPVWDMYTGIPPDWSTLPEVVVSAIMRMVPVLDRLSMAHTCSQWQAAATTPHVWHCFDYSHSAPLSQDSQPVPPAEQQRTHQMYLEVVSQYAEVFTSVRVVLHDRRSVDILKRLAAMCKNVCACTVEVPEESALDAERFSDQLSQLLSRNEGLQELCLKNVDFEDLECYSTFTLGKLNFQRLRKLSLINSFQDCNMAQLMYAVKLTELTLSPHQLRPSWLGHLSGSSLRTLNIVGDEDLLQGLDSFRYPCEHHWRSAMQASTLQVNCYRVSSHSKLLCPEMPLAVLACLDLFATCLSSVPEVTKPYYATLTTLVCHAESDRLVHRSVYHNREDKGGNLLRVAQRCLRLHTLALLAVVSSSTFLLMIQINPNLRDLIVREDCVRYKLEIPQDVEISEEALSFTRDNYTQEKFTEAVSRLLKRKWRLLTKKEYEHVINSRYLDW